MTLDSIAELPKAELHVHLEGTMRPATLLALAKKRRVSLPATDADGVRRWLESCVGFEAFVPAYLTCCRCLRDPEDFQLLVDDYLASLAEQGVEWCEAHLTIGAHLANGVNGAEVAHALGEAVSAGERRHGVALRLIPDIVRDTGPKRADRTVEWALDHRRHGVVALGLSGFETTSCEPYREHFRAAAAEGLHRVAHAGEQAGPDSIRATLEVTGAERLGHGFRAAEDPALVEELAARGIPLEICPTSNLRLGHVEAIENHPVDTLHRAGVPITINSDDPGFFDTTLVDEYRLLAETFGYDETRLAALAKASLDHSFRDDAASLEVSYE